MSLRSLRSLIRGIEVAGAERSWLGRVLRLVQLIPTSHQHESNERLHRVEAQT
jgi:hypothetical protein